MTDKIDAAKLLAKRGFRVFPLAINGKVPALDGNWQKIATTDPAAVDRLWTCPVFASVMDYNIGIALDADDVVIDVDVRDGKRGDQSLRLWEAINEELPKTYEVTTASGGRHLYFKSDLSGRFPARLAEHIDIKDHGDFVVGPGSEIDGSSYVGRAGGVVRLPGGAEALASEAVSRIRHPAATSLVDADSAAAVARATEWLIDRAPEAVEGHGGDAQTVAVANEVGDFGISREMCAELMLEHWNEAKAIPPWDSDALAEKVDNAYRYRQNAIGVAAPEAELSDESAAVAAREEQRRKERAALPPTQRRGLYFVPWEAAAPDLDRPYLVDDVLDAGSMIVTYGDSNVGKTYVVLDQAFHIATGKEWNGHKVRAGLVVYVAAEGGGGFARRIEALRRHHKAATAPFALVPCPVDLQSEQADTRKLIAVIKEAEAHYGASCVLVVIDTLARAMGGGDENTATDMGKFVGHCDRIRAATGAAVNIVHHTGKDRSKGARGSSALRAATDTEIEVDVGLFSVMKQRDMAGAKPLRFSLASVEIGTRADGKAVTACVVDWTPESEFEVRVSDQARALMTELEKLVAARMGEMGDEEADKADIGITWKEWEMAALSCLNGLRGKRIARSVLFRLRLELSQSGAVKQNKQNQWVICDLSQQSQ